MAMIEDIFTPKDSDTICAVATPNGIGAQSTIKVSGSRAGQVVAAIFKPAKKEVQLTDIPPYTVTYGWVIDPTNDSKIDDALVLVMRAPHSYTGEDQVEISYHGNPYISQIILQLLINAGARLAEPGEYTRRALVNGKLNLSEAEAVADVIAASNRSALRLSIAQMRGLFHKRISHLREQVLELASLVELGLDFSEEDIEIISPHEILQRCRTIQREVQALATSYATSQVIKNGIPIAIVGATNAGKSTLLNGLLGDEKAIVSDIHGTTRDAIEDTINICGQTFRLVDTAGLRDTEDVIEHIGIEKALKKANEAELLLWVIDPAERRETNAATLQQLQRHQDATKIVPIVNKSDIAPREILELTLTWLASERFENPLTISAKDDDDIERVKALLHHHFETLTVADDEVMATNIRQAIALRDANDSLVAVERNLQEGLSGEIIAQDLRRATDTLGSVIGEVTSEDILASIFSHFCIGK